MEPLLLAGMVESVESVDSEGSEDCRGAVGAEMLKTGCVWGPGLEQLCIGPLLLDGMVESLDSEDSHDPEDCGLGGRRGMEPCP